MRSRTFRPAIYVVALGFVAATGFGVAQTDSVRTREASALPSGLFGVSIEVAPVPDKEGVYTCTGEVTDLATAEVLSNPTITFNAGEPATVRSGIMTGRGAGDLHEVKITVEVGSDGYTAAYTAEVTSAGKMLSLQKATIHLR